MRIDRRKFLAGAVTTTVGGKLALAATPTAPPKPATTAAEPDLSTWPGVRDEFLLSRDYIHMALMLLASHPRPVREAIDRHRRGLDENPVAYWDAELRLAGDRVRAAAADYIGGKPDDIALTGNTTTGLADAVRRPAAEAEAGDRHHDPRSLRHARDRCGCARCTRAPACAR